MRLKEPEAITPNQYLSKEFGKTIWTIFRFTKRRGHDVNCRIVKALHIFFATNAKYIFVLTRTKIAFGNSIKTEMDFFFRQ